MPLYAVKNLKTGETQEFVKTLVDYEEWKKENPDWDKDWSKQGRMTVKYRRDFLKGIHGHPDHEQYGQADRMQVTEENWDPNTPNDVLSNENIRWKDAGNSHDNFE